MNIINQDQFDTTIAQGITVVDFYADWCGPCKMLGPVLEEIAAQYTGKVNFVKVNVDDNNELAARFSIMSIPNVILFKDGTKKDAFLGNQPKDQVVAFIERNLRG